MSKLSYPAVVVYNCIKKNTIRLIRTQNKKVLLVALRLDNSIET